MPISSRWEPPTREQAALARKVASCKQYLLLVEQAASMRHYKRARGLAVAALDLCAQLGWVVDDCERSDRRRLDEALAFEREMSDADR